MFPDRLLPSSNFLAYYIDLILITHDQTVSGRLIELLPFRLSNLSLLPETRYLQVEMQPACRKQRQRSNHGIVALVYGVKRGNAVQIYLERATEISEP